MLTDVISKNGFSLERLATLCAVIDAGTIAAAAGPNTSRQSQFSRQIKELEEALGAQAFERIGKTLIPTPFGLQLARMSRTFFGAVEQLVTRQTAVATEWSVGGGEGMLRWVVVPCLARLRELDPPIHCNLRNLRSADVVRELELGRIDAGIVRRTAVSDALTFETLGTFEFVLVVPRRLLWTRTVDAVFDGRPIPYGELAGDGNLATTGREICARSGIRLSRVIQAESLSLLLSAVEQGDVAAFLPTPSLGSLPVERFAKLGIAGIEQMDREMVLAWVPEATDQKNSLKQGLRILARALQQHMSSFPKIELSR